MKFSHVIKTALGPILILACTACATNGQSTAIDVAGDEMPATADRPCLTDKAYFDGMNGKPASTNCNDETRPQYLQSWQNGLQDAKLSNNRYISKARDIQLRALEDLNNSNNKESREKSEKLFKQMNVRITVLTRKNDDLTALLSTVVAVEPSAEDAMRTATIAEKAETVDD